MKRSMYDLKSSSRVANARANSRGPMRGSTETGTAKPVIDSVIASIMIRCSDVRPSPVLTAAATAPAMTRASAASGGPTFTSPGAGNGAGTSSPGSRRIRPARQLPPRPDEVTGVAIGVPLEVVLVLGLGLPEGSCGRDLRRDLSGPQAG